MILQALSELAHNEGLMSRPDYEAKRISWRVTLNNDGEFLNLSSQRIDLNAGTNRKPKYVGKWAFVPRQPTRTSGAKAFFLVDKSEYAFGLDPTGKQKPDKLVERSVLFREKIEKCGQETEDSAVRAVAAFLKRLAMDASCIADAANFAEFEPNDLIGFSIGSEWVHDRPKVAEYFGELRESEMKGPDAPTKQCLVTGDRVGDVPLFPLLKRVPGGTSSGVALVSHNSNAFYSFDLKGNDNAPISRMAAEACGSALSRLLEPDFPDPNDVENSLGPRHVRLAGDSVVCFWTKDLNEESSDFMDCLPSLMDGQSEDSVTGSLQSIWKGQPAKLESPNDFYALILSGTQGRAVVRDWIETSLEDVNRNLAKHFSDLDVCRNTQPKKGTKASPAVPMYWLLKSLAAEGRSESVPPNLEANFVRSAIYGTEYPFQLLQRALVRTRAEADGDEWSDSMRRDARAAIIRAVLNRRRSKDEKLQTRYPEVDIEMNPNLNSSGYSCGMLMAVLERLQTLALDDVNASVVDRFFGAASASPRSVFVRLLKNSQHHYRKIRDDADKRGSARYLERIKDEILSRFTVAEDSVTNRVYPQPSGIPLHLNLEQQGLFVLGYHQMRHWLWMTKEDRAKWEEDYPDAASVFTRKKPAKDAEATTA